MPEQWKYNVSCVTIVHSKPELNEESTHTLKPVYFFILEYRTSVALWYSNYIKNTFAQI